MSDSDHDGSILEWIRGILKWNSGDGEGSDGESNEVEMSRSDPRDGLLAQHERDKMDDFVESASEKEDNQSQR